MFVSLEDTYNLLNENTTVPSVRDVNSITNKFKTRVKGIIIQDSYNNPFFPIRPRPILDTASVDTSEIYRRYREEYSQFDSAYLPWHFCVEMIEDRYYVLNTRPLDLKFPMTSNEILKFDKKNSEWDDITQMFFKDKIFDISDAIHITIVGNSNRDVYTKKIYEIVGRSCIIPILRQNRLPGGLYNRVFAFNLGKRFNLDYITKFIRK